MIGNNSNCGHRDNDQDDPGADFDSNSYSYAFASKEAAMTNKMNMAISNHRARRRHPNLHDRHNSPLSNASMNSPIGTTMSPSLPLSHTQQSSRTKFSTTGNFFLKKRNAPRLLSTRRQLPRSNYHPHHMNPRRGNRGGFFPHLISCGFMVIVVGYGVIFWYLNYISVQNKIDFMNHFQEQRIFENQLQPSQQHRNHYREPEIVNTAKQILEFHASEQVLSEEIKQRQEERRRRTSPQRLSLNLEEYDALVKPYQFDFLKNQEQEMDDRNGGSGAEPRTKSRSEIDDDEIKMKVRCGINTHNAFAANPSLYPEVHGLNENSVVLITGILTRIGFHLALALSTQCNIQVMFGVASLYPNESNHKLLNVEQMSILFREVDGLKEPLILAFDGLTPKPKHRAWNDVINEVTNDFDFATYAKPTHIVHLFSAEQDPYFVNVDADYADSPYSSDNGLFGLRQSLVATEQLLANLGDVNASKVHFTLVSNMDVLKMNYDDGVTAKGHRNGIYTTTKIMEEVLLQSYAKKLRSNAFVTLRIPKVYGPWGKPGSFDYDMAQKAIMHWHDKEGMARDFSSVASVLLQSTVESEFNAVQHDVIFVDDAVDAIITAMQFWKDGSSVEDFNLLSGEKISMSMFATLIENHMPIAAHNETHIDNGVLRDKDGTYLAPAVAMKAKDRLHWAPKTFLEDGVKKLLAWHLDQQLPFGPPIDIRTEDVPATVAAETGDAFLTRVGGLKCDHGDKYCFRGHRAFPCSSECSDPLVCVDTPSFDRAAELSRELTENCKIVLYIASLSDGITNLPVPAPRNKGDSSICSIAFISKNSDLAIDLSRKYEAEKSSEESVELVHEGWTMVLVDAPANSIDWNLSHILKMSPGKFFHSSVKSAIFLPEDFPTHVGIEDIEFTTSLLKRKQRGPFYPPDNNWRMKHWRYIISDSDQEALIVLPGILSNVESVDAVFDGSFPTSVKRMDLSHALRQFSSNRHIKFEENVHLLFNSGVFEGSDPSLKFLFQHWTRNHWVAHNLERVEARNFRCEWYKEHTKWSDENHNISFAHIMARLQVEHFNNLVNDDEKAKMRDEQIHNVDMTTDEYEWHALTDRNSGKTGYVRIVDDRALLIERALWKQVRRIYKKSVK